MAFLLPLDLGWEGEGVGILNNKGKPLTTLWGDGDDG